MAFRLKILTANVGLDQIVALFPAGATIKLYKNTIPTDADTATSGQTLLCTIVLPAAPWAAASTRYVVSQGTWSAAASAGWADTATWFRLENGAATHRIDGTCGIG